MRERIENAAQVDYPVRASLSEKLREMGTGLEIVSVAMKTPNRTWESSSPVEK
jgi:hypothetical protein